MIVVKYLEMSGALYVHLFRLAYVKMKSAVSLTYNDDVKTFDTKVSIPYVALSGFSDTTNDSIPDPDGIKLQLFSEGGFYVYASICLKIKYLIY